MPQEPLAGRGNDIWGRLWGRGALQAGRVGSSPKSQPQGLFQGKEGQSW